MGKGWNAIKSAARPRAAVVATGPSINRDSHVKPGRMWVAALGGTRAEVVPASNRVSLRVAEHERLVRLARSNLTHKYMLLPDSLFRYIWDLLLAITTVLLIWRVPYTIAFGDSDLWYWFAFNKITDAIYLFDVVLNFRTGYVKDTEVIMDSRLVAKHYIKSWFIVDLIGSIPVEYIVSFNSTGISSVERKAFKASVKYMKVPKLFRVARIIKFVQKYMKFAYAAQVFACYISIIHWVACLWAGPMLGLTDVEDPQLAYNEAFYSAVLLMLNISAATVDPEWQFLAALFGVIGFLFQCLTLASITAGVIGSSSRALQYQEKVRMVMSDLKALHVPRELRKAARSYYDTLWRMKNTSDRYEKAIYEDEDLSPALRTEIALFIHRNLIATVPLFQDCSDSCLAACVMRLKTQLYMRGDVVFHKGDPANSMVIISQGKVKVISPDNEGLLAVLKQGSFFGEIGLLRHMTRSCTVIAGTFCELKSLERADAEEIFDAYPHIHDRLFAEAEKRRLDTRLKARLYNVKVLDNAHAVDVSSIVEVPGPGGTTNQSFVDGAADDKPPAPSLSSLGSSNKPGKLVRGGSVQTEDGIAVDSELDTMNINLEEIQRLVEMLKATQGRLSRVQERRQSIHMALNSPTPIHSINSMLFTQSPVRPDSRHSTHNRESLHSVDRSRSGST
ncbi:Potassium/sodium hyperpolarization-activated cyclic nucleotide-gated channel 2 [Phytophthora citrophthora]|uniref:Potassium/sodium hyperpolarization-activated cyclic nucleotide-gated channel 2 n=1 Tax=Phytophthora citrophthora TaxID=4793 RepID=A0AAD9LIQ3_9STRA|nr:Potassium/sodium hyperpolarization-activated cyclic nucleotide-gated channel 2 [Phytophthora citrophthora]